VTKPRERRLAMKEGYHKKEILARGKIVFIGIDVHKENWQVTVRSEGQEIFQGCSICGKQE
jgi:predicted RNA-binding protein with PUA domain